MPCKSHDIYLFQRGFTFATLLIACVMSIAVAATAAPATTSPTTSASTQPVAPPPPPPAPFSLADAATQGELAGVSLRNINAQLGDAAQLSDIEGQTPVLGSEIDNRLAESTSLLAAHPSLQ